MILMLEIRQEQYEALNENAREQFFRRVIQYLRTEWKSQCEDMDQSQLETMVREQTETAESYGIEIEADVVKYLEIALQLGEDFDTSEQFPWAQKILTNQETDGTIKIQQLRTRLLQLLDDLSTEGE
jgi:hypothetical protein